MLIFLRNTFIALRDLNLERLKLILEELEQFETTAANRDGDVPEDAENASKLSLFYRCSMDEAAVEQAGTVPIRDMLTTCSESLVSISISLFLTTQII